MYKQEMASDKVSQYETGVPVAVLGVVTSLAIAYVGQLVPSVLSLPEDVMMRGAMFAPDVFIRGEWWRVVSYAWLHDGLVHLAMNVVGLYAIGVWIERLLGAKRFLGVYLSSCLGGGLLSVFAWRAGWVPEQAIIGASGGVMGLVGAMAAVFLQGAVKEKATAARRGLAVVSSLIVLQVLLDLAMAQTSFLTHASGLVVGFVAGLGVLRKDAAARSVDAS